MTGYNWTTNTQTPITVDGQLGPQTTRALQYALGITVDGEFGPQTAQALQTWLGVLPDGSIGPVSTRALQAKLGVTQDGEWGPITTTALQTYLNDGGVNYHAPAGTPVIGSTGAAGISTNPPSTGNTQASTSTLTQWIGEAFAVLEANGTPASKLSVNDVLIIITHESTGVPNAINNYDINAQNGDPSRGLMQTIGTTFDEWALPGYNSDIYDPVSNIIAACRYAIAAYGSVQNVPGVVAVLEGRSYVGY